MDEVQQPIGRPTHPPPADPMGILLNRPGELAPMPHLVTVQLQFRIDAVSPERAQRAVVPGITIGLPLVGALVAQGVDAQPLTAELVAELTRLAKEQGVKL